MVSATEVISAGLEGIILESVMEGYAEYYSADLEIVGSPAAGTACGLGLSCLA